MMQGDERARPAAAHLRRRGRALSGGASGVPEELFDALVDAAGLRRAICCWRSAARRARRRFRWPGAGLRSPRSTSARSWWRSRSALWRLSRASRSSRRTSRPGGRRHSQRFHLVYAATAWHWVDPDVRYRRAWELLQPNGHLAFWSATHVFPDGGDPFFVEIQDVYDEIEGDSAAEAVRPRPGELPDQRQEIESSGLFTEVVVRQFDWEIRYDADAYIALLDTFSGHIAMAERTGPACTRRSGADSRGGRMVDCGDTGVLCCTWRGVPAAPQSTERPAGASTAPGANRSARICSTVSDSASNLSRQAWSATVVDPADPLSPMIPPRDPV